MWCWWNSGREGRAWGKDQKGAGRNGLCLSGFGGGKERERIEKWTEEGKCVVPCERAGGACEGCLVTPGLGNVSPEMTNILSLAGSCEKEGFTCYVLLLRAMSVSRFLYHVCLWIP